MHECSLRHNNQASFLPMAGRKDMNFVLALACEAKSWRVRPPRRGRSSRRLREEATIPSFKHKKKTRHHTVYIEGEFSSDM